MPRTLATQLNFLTSFWLVLIWLRNGSVKRSVSTCFTNTQNLIIIKFSRRPAKKSAYSLKSVQRDISPPLKYIFCKGWVCQWWTWLFSAFFVAVCLGSLAIVPINNRHSLSSIHLQRIIITASVLIVQNQSEGTTVPKQQGTSIVKEKENLNELLRIERTDKTD